MISIYYFSSKYCFLILCAFSISDIAKLAINKELQFGFWGAFSLGFESGFTGFLGLKRKSSF
jgi:hypothetical protein